MSGLGGQVDQLQRVWHVRNIGSLYAVWEFAGVVADEHGHGIEPAGLDCDHPCHVLVDLAAAELGKAIASAVDQERLTLDQLRDLLHQRVMSGVDVAKAFEIHAGWLERSHRS